MKDLSRSFYFEKCSFCEVERRELDCVLDFSFSIILGKVETKGKKPFDLEFSRPRFSTEW